MRLLLAALASFLIADICHAQYIEGDEELVVAQMYVRRTLVVIHNRTDSTQGTGFLIREDNAGYSYVLTNQHVASPGKKLKIDLHPHGSIDVLDSIQILASDESRDLTLMRFKTAAPTPCLTIRPLGGQRLHGRTLLAAGFPHHKLTFKQYRPIDHRVATGTYSRSFFDISADFGAGGSGSPVIGFTEDGKLEVVGVYHAHRGERGVACYRIAEFLSDSGYRNLIGDGVPSAQRSSQAAALIAITFETAGR